MALLVTHVLLCRVAYVAQAEQRGAAEVMENTLVHLYRARAVLLELVSNCTKIRHIATATACLANSWPDILPKHSDKQGSSLGSPSSSSSRTTGVLEVSMQYLVYEWYIIAANPYNPKFIDHESTIRGRNRHFVGLKKKKSPQRPCFRQLPLSLNVVQPSDYPYNSNMEKESAQYVLEQMHCESFLTGAKLVQPLDVALDAIMEAFLGVLQYFKRDSTIQASKTFSHQSLALLATFPLTKGMEEPS